MITDPEMTGEREQEDRSIGGMAMNIGIVVSEFNFDITMMMLEQAKIHAKFLGANVKKVITVPGVYDIPLAVNCQRGQHKVPGGGY